MGGEAAQSSNVAYHLKAGPYREGQLLVHAFRGREALSKLYQFDIVVTSRMLDDTLERTLLGRRALLTLELDGVHRDFHGIVSGIEAQGLRAVEPRVAQHRLRLVPRAWILRKRKGSRIFEDKRVDQVIAAVLREAGVASRFRLARRYPVRRYCTQYAETDYDFIARLAAENGMFFYFEQPRDFVDIAEADLLGMAANLASDVAGEVGQSAGNALGSLAGGAAGSILGEVAGGIAGGIGAAAGALLPGEVMVFCDNPAAYPALDDDAVAPALERVMGAEADALIGTARGAAGSALGELAAAAGGAAGGAAASLVGELSEGALRAAFGATAPAPPLHFREVEGLVRPSSDGVSTFTPRQALRPLSASYREYDPERPQTPIAASARARGLGIGIDVPELVAEAAEAAAAAAPALGAEVSGAMATLGSAMAPVLSAAGGGAHAGMEVYEHHPRHLFPDWLYCSDEPRRILEQSRRRHQVARGTSFCARLHVGRRFALEDHPQDYVNRSYALTAVEHRGVSRPPSDGAVYRNTFRCVPAEVPFVPRRPAQRVIQTCLTATVVSSSGDIHTNDKGEIRVRFHWVRPGHGAQSSCWIRTMHAWGGAGWGTQFIPRVGMEVVIGFDEGDPDRPIVLGCVYNATHPTAFQLPSHRTRSGIRTRTSPDGNGFNELSFDDASGNEQVFLHAERDFDSVVQRDRTARVQRDDRIAVARDRSIAVEGAHITRVTGENRSELGADDNLRVRGSRHTTVHGDLDEHVVGQRAVHVEGNEHSEIVGERRATVHGELRNEVRGAATMMVGRHDAKRSCTLVVEGATQLTGSESVDVASDSEIVLRCGKSSIRIGPEAIEIASPKVTVRGTDARLLLAEGNAKLKVKNLAQVVSDDSVVLKARSAGLGLCNEAKVDGSSILLNSPAQATDQLEVEEPELTRIELVDQDGTPIAYQRFRIVMGDGSHYTGFLDEEGKAEIDIDQSGEIVFPDLSEFQRA